MGERLVIDNISYSYHNLDGETLAIKDLSFKVAESEFVAIVGPSGCGKSTLLSLIAGLIKPSSGSIYINESSKPLKNTNTNELIGVDNKNNIKEKSPGNKIGYMLQTDQLLDWRTTFENVTLGLEIQDKLTNEIYETIEELLNTYGLRSFKNAKPSELSGGMRQRVALIRTLVLEPDILLLDEPFSALDYQTRLEVADDIWTIIRKEQKTALLVTHDISEAVSMADRIIVLTGRPATIKSIVDIKLTIDDKTPFRARSAPEFKDYFNLIWKELEH
ncbi:MAG: ABC transporter ATP-binding protein [Clostridiales bacterium]|nr:ABC transporter ATP-binding protein [Clostridiales bacterium]